MKLLGDGKMLKTLILAVILGNCPETHVINHTEIWTAQDQESLEFNKNSCMRWFGERSPCLKIFIKKRTRSYHAVCGKSSYN